MLLCLKGSKVIILPLGQAAFSRAVSEDDAMAERETYYIAHLKAKILAKLGDKEGATAAAKRSTELAIKAEGPKSGYVKMNEDLISSLH